VWAEVFGFECSFKTVIDLKIRRADLAAQLGFFFAVVVVQVCMWRVAEWTFFGLRDRLSAAQLDGFERSAMLGLVCFKQKFVV
jgi:hypothetical protein